MHGNRIIVENAGKTTIADESGAKSGALHPDLAQIDPDLQAVIDAWQDLPESVKSNILALARQT